VIVEENLEAAGKRRQGSRASIASAENLTSSTFGAATADFLAGNIVSNDLAGTPGHGVMVDIDWADGFVPDSNLIRWVGAPAEITP